MKNTKSTDNSPIILYKESWFVVVIHKNKLKVFHKDSFKRPEEDFGDLKVGDKLDMPKLLDKGSRCLTHFEINMYDLLGFIKTEELRQIKESVNKGININGN